MSVRIESVLQVINALTWAPTLIGVLLVTRSQRATAADARASERAVVLEREHRRAYEAWGAAMEAVVISTERFAALTRRYRALNPAERMNPGAYASVDAVAEAVGPLLEREAAARVSTLLVESVLETRTEVNRLSRDLRDLSPHTATDTDADIVSDTSVARLATLRVELLTFIASVRTVRL